MTPVLYDNLLVSAINFVSYRPRSVAETEAFLSKKLSSWKLSDDGSMAKVITRLVEMDYLNDYKFAVWLVASRRRHKPKGDRFIARELLEYGIHKDIIEKVLLPNSSQGQGESERARVAVEKKVQVWKKYPVLVQKRKLFGFLSRRGFSPDTIKIIIDEVAKKDYNSSNP